MHCPHVISPIHYLSSASMLELFVCFVPHSPIVCPLLACNLPTIVPFSVFQSQPLPPARGLMNVAHVRVTSEITPPFFPKKIHQAQSASPRDVWFSTQGKRLSQRPQMARYCWGARGTVSGAPNPYSHGSQPAYTNSLKGLRTLSHCKHINLVITGETKALALSTATLILALLQLVPILDSRHINH